MVGGLATDTVMGGGAGRVVKISKKGLENLGRNLDNLTPPPAYATVSGTPDIRGGATVITGKPKPDGGIGGAEMGGAILAVGSEEAQNPKGIYDSRGQRSDLEAVYGENNVTSTTVPKKPHQASSNRNDVSIDMNGNKAVEVTLKDGTVKMIPYDSRGLAIFDDVVVFTTKIDTTKSYTGQMRQASLDMWKVIKDDPIAQSKFTSSQLDSLKRGKAKVEGYTWHHNAQSAPNSMQLIPNDIHSNKTVPHTGQNSLKEGQ